jgi:hypothetical protein
MIKRCVVCGKWSCPLKYHMDAQPPGDREWLHRVFTHTRWERVKHQFGRWT